MRFHYVAFQQDGKITEGNAEGKDQAEILAYLGKRGLRPVKIDPIVIVIAGRKKFFGQRITTTDKIFITKYLGLMLKVGTDLFRAIDILIADFDKPVIKGLMVEIRGSLERGEPFHSTFAKYPEYFSPVFINLIKAGESSGNLNQVLEDLNKSLEKEGELRSRLRAALIYPVILVVMAVMILTFLVTFALPKVAEIFSGGGFEPPIFSRIVFTVGLFLSKYIWLFLGLGILLIAGSSIFFFKTQTGKMMLSKILASTPIVKGLVSKIALQRFAGTLGSLLRSGLPILEALEITADAVGNEQIASSLKRISREGVTKGLTVGEAFKREAAFPAVVSNLVAVSEKAGHLDEILATLGNFYETEIDASVKTLVSLIEPALLVAIGIVVAVIALSIIIPIYQLVGQFS
ncbi:MAG: type II secretion system F family protein [Patescibacteria group bacterium]